MTVPATEGKDMSDENENGIDEAEEVKHPNKGNIRFLGSGEPVISLGDGRYGKFAEIVELEEGQDHFASAPEPDTDEA